MSLHTTNTLRCSRQVQRNSKVCWTSINFSRALGALSLKTLLNEVLKTMTDQALRNTLQNYLLVSVAEFVSFMVQRL